MARASEMSGTAEEIGRLGFGDHLCCIYRDAEEQMRIMIPYFSSGLKNHEKCLYIVDESSTEFVRQAFIKAGVEIDECLRSGQFAFLTKEDAYLKGGSFDPERMIATLKQAEETALQEGYSGLRVTGEMTWALSGLPGSKKLIEYESKLNYFFPNSQSSAICQYHESRFDPDILIDVIHTHPKLLIHGLLCSNRHYIPPDEFLRRVEPDRFTEFVYQDIRDGIIASARAELDRRRIEGELKANLERAERSRRAMLGALEDSKRAQAALKKSEGEVRKLNAELEDRVKERTSALESANMELEAFSYSVSHDLRAPLRAIDGFARILAEEQSSRLDAEGLRVLGVIRSSTAQMDRLISDLLEFSRMSRCSIEAVEIDLASIVRSAFEFLRAAEPQRSMELRMGELPRVYGDRAMLQQAVTNLISNAVKFTRPREHAVIEVSGEEDEGEVRFRVSDNGVGFDMRYVDKLFKVFQRLHTTVEFEGTGVGLAIVARIVKRHGGRVEAISESGKGSTFLFTLPRRQSEGSES